MSTTIISQTETRYLKQAGRVLGKFGRMMGLILLASIIVTAIAVGQSNPRSYYFDLEPGESTYLSSFYASEGQALQVGFGIEAENGMEYNYPEGDTLDWYEFTRDMEWKLQILVERSDDLKFTKSTIVGDYSGEVNVIQMTLQQGFYRVQVINHADATLSIIMGQTTPNLGIVLAAVVLWIAFSIMVSIFVFLLHLGFWFAVIYMILKITLVLVDDQKSTPEVQVITPNNNQQ